MDGDGGGGSDLVTEGRTEDGVVRDRWTEDSSDSTESKLQSLGYQLGGGHGSGEMKGKSTESLAALIASGMLKVAVVLLSVIGVALLVLSLL
jgi:hypothetical protein